MALGPTVDDPKRDATEADAGREGEAGGRLDGEDLVLSYPSSDGPVVDGESIYIET